MNREELLRRQRELEERLNDPELTDEQLTEIEAEITEVRSAIDAFNTRTQRAAEARARLAEARPDEVVQTGETVPPPEPRRTDRQSEARTNLGERFVANERVQELRSAGWPRGQVAAVDAPELTLRALLGGTETRTLVDSGTGQGGAFQRPPLLPVVPQLYADRGLTMADLLDRGTTSYASVDYVEDDTAQGVGTAAETAEGVGKPEAAFSFVQKSVPVATIAHWIALTRQAADDNKQLQSYIEGRMRYGLLFRLDAQILSGNGTTPNMRGILNTSGVNTQAPSSSEARIITIRKAKTSAQSNEYQPDGVVLNPADWEAVELSTDSTGEFRVTPSALLALPPRIWGMAVVETTAIASGTGLVGAFKMGATLWDREQTQVIIGFVNDDLIKNRFTLLCELRAALTVFRPKAFTKCTFSGSS